MKKSVKSLTVSVVLAVALGGGIALGLYGLSKWFFKAKNKQTLIKSTELGNEGSGDVVWAVGAKLPEVSFKRLSKGSEYVLSGDPAPIKIVNFWASWCEPCVEEFSSFARLLGQIDAEDISFVGVNEDSSEEAALEFLKAFDHDFKNIPNAYFGYDNEKALSKKYGVLALPETFIVNRKGELVRRVSGFENWDTPQAVKYFKQLIERAR